MKTFNMLLAAALLSALPVAAIAAQQVVFVPAGQTGDAVSATGSTSLTSLESQLSAKGAPAGSTSLRIGSTSGLNKLHGTAAIYN